MLHDERYKQLSNIQKLSMILSVSLNNLLSSMSFGINTFVVVAEYKKGKLVFYNWTREVDIESKEYVLDISTTDSDEDLAFQINKNASTFDVNKSGLRRIPMSETQEIGTIDGNRIFVIPTATESGFPKGLMWLKAYEVFVSQWQSIIEDLDENPIFDYSDADDAVRNIYTNWGWSSLTCCRVLSTGGFNTGYGDPYESEFLFHVFNDLASMNYEKRSKKGIIVPIIDENSYEDSYSIKFKEKIPLDMHLSKAYRKFLEMTTDKLALAFGKENVTGLIDASFFDWKVIIYGNGKWKYFFKDQVIFTVINGKVHIGNEAEQVASYIPIEDEGKITNPHVVETIIREAMKQPHGTSVVFSNAAKEEAERLAGYRRCVQIEPINLAKKKELIVSLTSIDGALMVDFDGNCVGIGAILDGEAQSKGDFGRGARFNSAINYVGWKKIVDAAHEYCVVVISEDGIFDIIATKTIDRIEEELNI